MINTREVQLFLVKGDTLAFNMEFSGLESDLSSAYFGAKTNPNANDYAFLIELNDGISKTSDGIYLVRLAPDDTSSLTSGIYYYSLKVGVSTDVYTIMFGQINIIETA